MSTTKTVELSASHVPVGATLLYRGQEHKVSKVRNTDRKWVQFIEPGGHIIYRRFEAKVTVKATPRTLALAA